MIEVTNRIRVYEVNGKESPASDPDEIRLSSAWKDPRFVVLEVGDQRYKVLVRDLEAAINNASNTAPY